MKSWQLLVSLVILGVATWAIFNLLPQEGSSTKKVNQTSTVTTNYCTSKRPQAELGSDQMSPVIINQDAPITPDGSPLPSTVKEDVEIRLVTTEFTQDISGSFLFYDHDSGNWETQFVADGSDIKLCFIGEQIFIENVTSWDEVDPALLIDELDVRQYILSAEQIHDFNRQAIQLEDQTCDSNVCAVWRATISEPPIDITIRVNKFNRKIVDVTIVDDDGILLATYNYRPIRVSLPEPVRYLPPAAADN